MRILSGIKPTGELHIGNYIGAISQWLAFQKEHECFFFIADLHALTIRQKPETLKEKILSLAALYLACGIDPQKTTFFAQSHVPAHTELAWILNCVAKVGEMEGMIEFKEKAKKHKDNINMGLLDYPALMAADILLYAPDKIPVGEDQKQHIELTRELARRFNAWYGDILKIPEPLLLKEGAKIMSLTDPTKKMSKDTINKKEYISLLDSPNAIQQKIKTAVTDSGREIRYDPRAKPALSNLILIYSVASSLSLTAIEQKFKNARYADFKKDLAEQLISFLSPIQEKYHSLRARENELTDILRDGARKASHTANETLAKVKDAIGLV